MKKVIVFILALTMLFSSSSISFAADSYSEYFSEEREFIVTDNALDSSTYLYSDEETGYLYSRNIDTKEEKLVYKENITNYYVYDEYIYCVVDGITLVKISINGNKIQTILTTNKPIDQLYINDDLIFYLMDNAIYRYHINSKITDCLAKDKYIYHFYPYSNFVVEYGDGSTNQKIYRVDSSSKNINILEQYTFTLDRENSSLSRSNVASNVKIHGKNIPLSNYDDGDYYNETGVACSCHPNGTYCPYGYSCTVCKVITGNNGSAMQCHALGCETYKYIWNGYINKYEPSEPINIRDDSVKVKEVFFGLPSGTMVRAYYRGSSSSNHTFIITNVTSTGATIYEANNPKACIVSHKTFTFAEIAGDYDKIKYVYTGNHTFGSSYGYDTYYHWNKCTHSQCNAKQNFTPHNFVSYGTGAVKCNTCQYIRSVSINSINDLIE